MRRHFEGVVEPDRLFSSPVASKFLLYLSMLVGDWNRARNWQHSGMISLMPYILILIPPNK